MNSTLPIYDLRIKALVELGAKGHFPLLHANWIKEICEGKSSKLSKSELSKAKKIMQELSRHKCIERKQTALLALSYDDRSIFTMALLGMIEGKILAERPELH